MTGSSSTESGDPDDYEIKRVNISLKKQQHEHFQDLAEEHYGGVVSRLIRTAVAEHEQQLEDVDMVELKKIRSSVETITQQIEELREELQGVNEQTTVLQGGVDPATNTTNAVTDPSDVDETGDDNASTHELVRILGEHDEPISMETIAAESDAKLSALHSQLSKALDMGIVSAEHGEPTRYELSNSGYPE